MITCDDWGGYGREVPKDKCLTSKIFIQCIKRNKLTLRNRIKQLARITICFCIFSRSVYTHGKSSVLSSKSTFSTNWMHQLITRSVLPRKQYCRHISVFVRTSPFAPHEPYYANSYSVQLMLVTQETRDIVVAAVKALDAIWRDGFRYQKAGIMLNDFCDKPGQIDLSDEQPPRAVVNS